MTTPTEAPGHDDRPYPARRTWNRGDFSVTVQVPRSIVSFGRRLRGRSAEEFTPALDFASELPQLELIDRDIDQTLSWFVSDEQVQNKPRHHAGPEAGELAEKVANNHWYHSIELPGGIVTPGEYDHRPLVPRYHIPASLAGQRVLDIATFDGFWAFEFERRGGDVTALDIPRFSDLDHPPGVRDRLLERGLDHTTGTGFRIAADALGSKVNRIESNIYNLNPDDFGMFDYVHTGDVLLHIREPLRALERIRSVTKGTAHIVDCIDRTVEGSGRRHHMQYLGGWHAITWWAMSVHTLAQMVIDAGFSKVELLEIFRLDLAFGRGPWRAILRATP